jgi:hypothetical protein
MSCACERKKVLGDRERVSELARKAAQLENKIMAVWQRNDGTYAFCGVDELDGQEVLEYRHWL